MVHNAAATRQLIDIVCLPPFKDNVREAKRLLNAGANPDAIHSHYGPLVTIAAKHGDLEMLGLLIRHNADVNATGRFVKASGTGYETPLEAATSLSENPNMTADMLGILLNAGANVTKEAVDAVRINIKLITGAGPNEASPCKNPEELVSRLEQALNVMRERFEAQRAMAEDSGERTRMATKRMAPDAGAKNTPGTKPRTKA